MILSLFAHAGENHELEAAQSATHDSSGLVLFIGIVCLLAAAALISRYIHTRPKTPQK